MQTNQANANAKSNTKKDMERTIKAYFVELMNDYTKRLVHHANRDLYEGPSTDCYECSENPCICEVKLPLFITATKQIREWADNYIPFELYYDNDCGMILESEPKPYTWEDEEGNIVTEEPMWENIYRLDRMEIKCIVFGSELASYV